MSDESYKDAPVSISEVRGLRDGKSGSWTPRDILIRMLRDIDNDKYKVDHLIIAFGERDGGSVSTGYMQAGSFNALEQMGLVAQVQHILSKD